MNLLEIGANEIRDGHSPGVMAGPKLEALGRARHALRGMKNVSDPSARASSTIVPSCKLGPASLHGRRDSLHAHHVVLPGRGSGHVDHVVARSVLAQQAGRLPGEGSTFDGVPNPAVRTPCRPNVVKLDACGLDSACLRVRIAVDLDALADQSARQMHALARQACLEVEVVEDDRYAHRTSSRSWLRVDRAPALGDDFRRSDLVNARPCLLPEAFSQARVRGQTPQRIGELAGLGRLDQEPALSILDHIGDSADAGRHDRQPEGHCFQKGHRQALAPRRKNEDVRALVKAPEGGRPEDSVEAHEVRQTGFAHAPAELCFLAPELFLPGEVELDRDTFPAKPGYRLDELGRSFRFPYVPTKRARQTGP